MISSPYGPRNHPIDGTPKQHTGLDIVNPVSDVVAAADGEIVRIGYNEKLSPHGNKIGYGQYVVVRHPGGSETLYAHLAPGSIDLANQLQIPYPKTPGPPPYVLPHPIPVTGGTDILGAKDTTGGATGPHLHFEYSTGSIFGSGRTDPHPCITLSPPVPCGSVQVAGGDTPVTRTVELGVSSGTFNFSYDTYSIPDRMVVTYQGRVLFDTGCVGASGSVNLSYAGTDTRVSVSVTPNCSGTTGTGWQFTVSCP